MDYFKDDYLIIVDSPISQFRADPRNVCGAIEVTKEHAGGRITAR